ncbi:MAG TPA: winged helix-turn-helix domain-containing protein [Candidatus Acidoferrum sp.]|nr:winged helix-turn-helix domain-containing protein [Candidatus Acidoferrum sp.]
MDTQANTVEESQLRGSGTPALTFPGRYAAFRAFQADFQREELYHEGKRVKVQAKLFQGLLLLLSRAGEVVTREEVRRHLWPDIYLGNRDANVNTTMNKLRQVLGDSPEGPLYIETIPRRGYCFIARVEFSDVPMANESGTEKADVDPEVAEPSAKRTKDRVQVFLRMAGLVFAGMILGALLAFVWFFEQAKSRRAANGARVNALLSTFDSQQNFG